MAFQNCERLCTLNLPDTVEDIGEMAFRDTAVQNLRVPPLVVTIDLSMVSDCNCLVFHSNYPNVSEELKMHHRVQCLGVYGT